MAFDESKHPRDDDGKFTDKGEAGKSLRDYQMHYGLEDGRLKYYRDRMETIQSQTKESHQNEISAVTIVELDKDNELTKRIQASPQSKYNTIKEYLMEAFREQPIIMPDGEKVVFGSKDMDEMKHLADKRKTAEIAMLKELINASHFDKEIDIQHKKFSRMRYYVVTAKYEGKVFDIWINVGRNKSDKKLHLYDLVPKK